MNKALFSVFAVLVLTGCTAGPSTLSTTENQGMTPTSSTAPGTPAGTVTPVDPDSLTCEPPDGAVMLWLQDPERYPNVTDSTVVMVKTAEGNTPSEYWWTVAFTDGPQSDATSQKAVYLTNVGAA